MRRPDGSARRSTYGARTVDMSDLQVDWSDQTAIVDAVRELRPIGGKRPRPARRRSAECRRLGEQLVDREMRAPLQPRQREVCRRRCDDRRRRPRLSALRSWLVGAERAQTTEALARRRAAGKAGHHGGHGSLRPIGRLCRPRNAFTFAKCADRRRTSRAGPVRRPGAGQERLGTCSGGARAEVSGRQPQLGAPSRTAATRWRVSGGNVDQPTAQRVRLAARLAAAFLARRQA